MCTPVHHQQIAIVLQANATYAAANMLHRSRVECTLTTCYTALQVLASRIEDALQRNLPLDGLTSNKAELPPHMQCDAWPACFCVNPGL